MSGDVPIAARGPGWWASAMRESRSLLAALIVGLGSYLGARWVVPGVPWDDVRHLAGTYLGFSWPFFGAVIAFLFYVVGAWIVDALEIGPRRDWRSVGHALHWATEASPLVGLLTTFVSLLNALLAYSEAGPGQPETQAAFISQFAIAFGSSIAGGLLALCAFTLHRLLPVDGDEP